MKTSNFAERVYTLLKQVPEGKVTTYKELGQALETKAYRAIGQVLKNNPNAPVVPCHRVVKTDGKIGGFMGETKGSKIREKISLLKNEGVHVEAGQVVDFNQVLHHFN